MIGKHLLKWGDTKLFFSLLAGSLFAIFQFVPTGSVFAGAGDAPPQVSILEMKQAPKIDGVIEEVEWREAVRTEWFQRVSGERLLDPREGSVWVGCDKDRFYIAVSSELPPGGSLVSSVKVPDGPTIYDDSIEICIDPFLTERLKDSTAPRPYYQFIGNSLGFVYDRILTPGKAASDTWNGMWEFKNRIDPQKNRWEAELAIAWSDLGVKPGADMTGREIGLIVCRNWKNPWAQSVWIPCAAFTDPLTYPRCRVDPKAPVVQIAGMGNIFGGAFHLQLDLYNPTDDNMDCAVEVGVAHSDMPANEFTETRAVEPGRTRRVECEFRRDFFHPDAKHTLTVKVTSPDKARTYFLRTVNWQFPVERRWKDVAEEQDAGIKFAYYPSFNKIRVRVDPESALGGKAAKELRVRIIGKNEKALAEKTFSLEGNGEQEFAMGVPDFDDGEYGIRFEFLNAGKAVKSTDKSFERIHFVWENRKLGVTDKVYPPFTPIRVENNTLDVVLRTYVLGKLGLPERIVANGHDILAPGGMAIRYVTADGQEHGFDDASGEFTETRADAAVYEGQARSVHIRLQAGSVIEYDGCAKVELEIMPVTPGVDLRELYLTIPLRKKYADLWHICEAGLRSNPAGSIPEGEGMIWDSSQTGNGSILGTFLPYIWMGREEEGIAWFADSDKGWVVEDATPEMQILRDKDGDVTLRVRFINTPVKLEKATRLVFGWQASPTKPMPENWRKPRNLIPAHGGANWYWGIRADHSGKYPAEHDYEFTDQLLITRKRKKRNPEFLARWYKKHYHDVVDEPLIHMIKNHINAGFQKAYSAGTSAGTTPNQDVMMLYFEGHAQDPTTPEWRIFQDEWGRKDFTAREWLKKLMALDDPNSVGIVPTPSYQDFTLWEAVEWLRRGIGIYCDNAFLHSTTNLEMSGGAYKRPDGNVQPGTGLWEMREYHKRMWVLVRQMREMSEYPLYLSMHMTNGNILPIMTWTDVNLDIEWRWDGGNLPFPPDLLRTETTGRQTGCYPYALHQCTAKKWFMEGAVKTKTGAMKYNPDAMRHDWGIQMVHEIIRTLWGIWGLRIRDYPLEKLVLDFGYGEPDCRVYNYWRDDYPVAVSDEQVKSVALERNGRVMLVLTSWIPEKSEIRVGFKGTLARYASLAAVDSETGEAYRVEDGEILVPMNKWGVRLVTWKENP